ncbi:MAG TPA: hypothetical protein VES68_01480 [Candidatus Sulfotelmatobacter sp.]|nr:hypothetical protein [Candidatus Sulfotelmatobacter sp.]
MRNAESRLGFPSREKVVKASIAALVVTVPVVGIFVRERRAHIAEEKRTKEVKLEQERIDYISDDANFAGA